MLKFLKTIHTIIWAVMAASNFLAFYFAFIGVFDYRFYIPAALITAEIIVILLNDWRCPITPMAEKYTEDRKSNFDIYLPEWLAKYNVKIFTILIVVEIFVVIIKMYLI